MTEKKEKNQKKYPEPHSLPVDEKTNNAMLQESKEKKAFSWLLPYQKNLQILNTQLYNTTVFVTAIPQ